MVGVLSIRKIRMANVPSTRNIILAFGGFILLAVFLPFLFGLGLFAHVIPAFPMIPLLYLYWAGLYLYKRVKHLQKASIEGETIRWYKQPDLMVVPTSGFLFIDLLLVLLIPDQPNYILKLCTFILLAALALGFFIYSLILRWQQHI